MENMHFLIEDEIVVETETEENSEGTYVKAENLNNEITWCLQDGTTLREFHHDSWHSPAAPVEKTSDNQHTPNHSNPRPRKRKKVEIASNPDLDPSSAENLKIRCFLEGGIFYEVDSTTSDPADAPANDINLSYLFTNATKKRTRRKGDQVDEQDWLRNRNISRREKGQPYFGTKKVVDPSGKKWNYQVERGERTLKSRCNCKGLGKECSRVTDEMRQEIFRKFWDMSWKEKHFFVCYLVECHNPTRPRHRKDPAFSRRENTYEYHLEHDGQRFQVCAKMFSRTLGVTTVWVRAWKNKQISQNVSLDSKEVPPAFNQTIKLATSSLADKKVFLKNFLESLPTMEPHYCRKDTKKKYLEPMWRTKSEVYDCYRDEWKKLGDIEAVTFSVFDHAFTEMKLALYRRKEECEVCFRFRSKTIAQKAYDIHCVKKEEATQEKDRDKQDSNVIAFAVGMQTFHAPFNGSVAMKFKQKLRVHNFTFCNLKTNDGYCLIWNEVEGDLSAHVIGTLYCYFIHKYVLPGISNRDTTRIVLYSDGFEHQHHNPIVSNALINCSLENNIIIEQKFLVMGHPSVECDSMLLAIENSLHGRLINLPADYVDIVISARQNKRFNVEYVTHPFFKKFTEVIDLKTIGLEVKTLNEVAALKYNGIAGTIAYKLKYSDDYTDLPSSPFNISLFEQLPPLFKSSLPISKDKYSALQQLKSCIPSDYRFYYDNLPFVSRKRNTPKKSKL